MPAHRPAFLSSEAKRRASKDTQSHQLLGRRPENDWRIAREPCGPLRNPGRERQLPFPETTETLGRNPSRALEMWPRAPPPRRRYISSSTQLYQPQPREGRLYLFAPPASRGRGSRLRLRRQFLAMPLSLCISRLLQCVFRPRRLSTPLSNHQLAPQAKYH